MKKVAFLLTLFASSFSFAQQSPNSSFGHTIFNYRPKSPNQLKLGLNMNSFKLEDFKQKTNSLTEFLRKSNSQRIKSLNNMPIFVPEGKFFLEIYDIDEDIDHKLRIFDLEKSKYGSRNLG